MAALTAALLAQVRSARAAHLVDQCVILQRQDGALDPYGMPVAVWIERGPLACRWVRSGLVQGARRETQGLAAVPLELSYLLLPVGVDPPTPTDEVSIVTIHGVALTPPLRLAVVGRALVTITGFVVTLQEPALP